MCRKPGRTPGSRHSATRRAPSREAPRRPASRRSCSSPSRSSASGTTRRHAPTPGSAAAAFLSRSKNSVRSAGATGLCCASTVTMRTGSRSNPVSTAASAAKVRTNRPAATTQHERERHLHDDQRLAEPRVPFAGRSTRPAPSAHRSDPRAPRVSPARCRTAAPSGWRRPR